MKKILMILLVVALAATGLTTPTVSTAASGSGSVYAQSMQRMMDLGIFSKTAPEQFALENLVTREQLAVLLIQLTGQEDKAAFYKNISLFSDVASSRGSQSYIAAAVKLGYMTSLPDGLFHPTNPVTFSEVSKIFGKLLKYEESSLSGLYPYNYLNLLANLGIFNGINYTSTGKVTRGQLAVMMDRLLNTDMSGAANTFAEASGCYKNLIILENSKINKDAEANRIVADSGVYFTDASLSIPEIGRSYIARIEDGKISKMTLASDVNYKEFSVKTALAGKISTNDKKTETLQSNFAFYYNGAVSKYDSVVAAIKANSSLITGTKSDGTGYCVLFDPVNSNPKVIAPGMTTSALETLYGGKTIDREGQYITASQIESDDVVYEITDIWGNNAYIIIYANSVSGEVTAILPNKISPTSIKLDDQSYALSPDFPIDKVTGQGSVQVGETARLLLNNEDKAIDIILNGESNNKDYVLVLNAYDQASTATTDYGQTYHYVTLLHSNGVKKTYRTEVDVIGMKGEVARYTIKAVGKSKDDYDTVELTDLNYGTINASQIDKETRTLDNSTVTNDAVIFNMIHNVYGTDSTASVLKWSDLPDGSLQTGKVLYLHKAGDFQDVDVILFNNILDQDVAYGIVTNITSSWTRETGAVYTASILIRGTTYQYKYSEEGLYLGEVIRVKMSGTSIIGVDYAVSAAATGKTVEAVDSTRIRMNGATYNYKSDVSILKYSDNTWKVAGSSEILKGDNLYNISVYLDKPISFGGKVILITLR